MSVREVFKSQFRLFLLLLAAMIVIPVEAELRTLSSHVPPAAKRLRPSGRLTSNQTLQLGIGLPLRNREALTNLLQRIYDPASPDFHQFLTAEQFAGQFGPTAEDYRALTEFATRHGLEVTGNHSNRMLLSVRGSVGEVEKAFDVHLRTYRHPTEARDFFAPDTEPSFDVSTPVLHVSGLDNFLVPRPMSLRPATVATPASGSGPAGTYMGGDFRAAYVPGTTLTGTGQSVGLLEFDGYYAGDVSAYRTLAALPNIPLKNVLLDGFNGAPGNNNSEVALDIDMAMSMAPGLSSILVYEGESTDDILNRMATDNIAKQLSASWLYPIDATSDQIFLQFAAQGQSFFNASGDYDAYVGGIATPADDPNITVVGGTTLSTTGAGGSRVSETAWNWGGGIGTSGGISTTYAIPGWQQGISMASNGGSTNMRNLPDIALTADNIWVIYNNGAAGGFGGTSCATPLWAAFTALVNQQAVANGRPLQGFINPALYAIGKGGSYNALFNDITNGNNTSGQSPTNYSAVPGYDLCTGWGTPNGTNLINTLAPLDALRITPSGGFSSSGGAGGPFSLTFKSFVLTNSGSGTLAWSLGNSVPWLSASPTGGTFPPHGPAITVTISLNATAGNEVAGAYSGTIWFTNLTDGFKQSRSFTLSVITPPTITSVPTNQSVLGGATAVFNAQAVGGLPLAYQWQLNGTNLSDGGNISGSKTLLLTVAHVAASNTGSYTLVVSNAAATVTSAPPALLSIIPSGPVIVSQPLSQATLVGSNVSFAVTALGSAPLIYQWQFNGTNLNNGGAIAGSTSARLTISAASATNAGTYSVSIGNALDSVSSTNAVLFVYALADMELIQNGGFETGDFSFWNQTGNAGINAVSSDPLFANAGVYGAEMGPAGSLGYLSQTVPTIPGETYLLSFWLDSPDGATPNEFFAGWNGYSLFDSTNLSAVGWSNFQFTVTASASNTTVQFGFRDDASFLGFDGVSLKPLLNPGGVPVITSQPASRTYATVGSTNFIWVVALGQPPLFYQWQSNGIPILNATNATLLWQNIAAEFSATYSVIISNSAGITTSSNAILTVLTGTGELINFDDLATTNGAVPNGYANLGWINFQHMDPVLSAPNPSGYIYGTVSQPNVAYNQFGEPAYLTNSRPFDFLSASVTAAWNDGLRLEARGYSSNGLVYDRAFTLSATSPTLIDFNCVGVTNMEFLASGGTPIYAFSGTEFVMDNVSLVISPVPPPPNDQCSGSVVVLTNPYTNSQSTVGATSLFDPTPGCISGFANGVWYEYTPPATGTLSVDATGSDFNTALAVYSGSCGALTPVACNAGVVPVTGGVNYYILAGAVGNLTGNLLFHLSFSSPGNGPPLLLASPTNLSMAAGNAAHFSITAEGAPPLGYQWQRNGTNVPGAASASLTVSNVGLADSGAQFSCRVNNSIGITNSVAAVLTVTPPGQLVQNGGFETGDFSFWTLSGNTLDTAVNNLFVHAGQYGAHLGPFGSQGFISQTLLTVPGQTYLISMWLNNPAGQGPYEFSVAWNGSNYFDLTALGSFTWSNVVVRAPASAANSVLKIGFRDDPSYLGLDDITVVPFKPVLQNTRHSGTNISFTWSALPGYAYQVQSITNLTRTNWTIVTNITATDYFMTVTEPTAGLSAQFFRLIVLP